MLSKTSLALFALPAALALPSGHHARQEGAAAFAATTTFDFSQATAFPDSGLSIDSGTIGSKPLSHNFDAANVAVKDGYLQLLVPGGQEGQQTISSAQVSTTFDVKYASVRTWAILTEVAGVCNGRLPSPSL